MPGKKSEVTFTVTNTVGLTDSARLTITVLPPDTRPASIDTLAPPRR